jgi:hypothetical protein
MKWKIDGLIHDGLDKSGRIFKGRLWLKKGCFDDDLDFRANLYCKITD